MYSPLCSTARCRSAQSAAVGSATPNYHAYRASNELARERGRAFGGFERSTYAKPAGAGNYFDRYVHGTETLKPRTSAVRELFARFGVGLPTAADWAATSVPSSACWRMRM